MDSTATNIATALPSARRLRVCVVTETYPPEVNGVAMTVSRLVRGLRDRGHELTLVRPRQDADDRPRREEAVAVYPVAGMPLPMYRDMRLGLPAAGWLQHRWRAEPPDLVHLVTEGPLGASALGVARRLGLPVSSGFHTNFHSYSQHYHLGWLRHPILAYLRRFHNRTHCTLVPTEELVRELTGQGFTNARVLARGVDTALFDPARRDGDLRRAWGADEATPVLLYVGRLAAEKNLELAVRAWRAFRRHKPAARLVLVGQGPLMEALRRRYPDIVFCGQRTGADLAAHYASADLFVFPSLTETFGNVTLEALASGLPVVAYDCAAARQHIRLGVNGLKAAPGDETGFVTAVESLGQGDHDLKAMGQAARQGARSYNWPTIIEELEAIFLELAGGAQHDEPAYG